MIDRQRIVTTGITTTALATVALVLWLRPWTTEGMVHSEKPEPVAQEKGRPVDIVFAVDTTGSMGGLLDGAKRTVWSIANQVRSIDPNADIRVGLVAYRDLGDDYVTKNFALTDDLDAMYAELSSYQAAGGGDVPENVDAALHDAVPPRHPRSHRVDHTTLKPVDDRLRVQRHRRARPDVLGRSQQGHTHQRESILVGPFAPVLCDQRLLLGEPQRLGVHQRPVEVPQHGVGYGVGPRHPGECTGVTPRRRRTAYSRPA